MPEFKDEAKEINIHLEGLTAQCYTTDLEQIFKLIDDGTVRPVVAAVFKLDKARQAEELSPKKHTR
jgi:NADPH:quinone reductase-like Zn-dependent oxidoreductase